MDLHASSMTAAPRKTAKTISVLVADPQRLLAEALAAALGAQPGLRVVSGVACRGRDAVDLALRERPDVVVVDCWVIGELNGIEAARAIHDDLPDTHVLVVSPAPGPTEVQAALEAGAAGFLPKSIGVEDLAEAVRRAHRGESPVFPDRLWRMVETIQDRAKKTQEVDARLAMVSAREYEVLRLLMKGHSAQDLAKKLFISEGTFRNHLHRILKKTGAKNQQELLRLVRNGAVEVQSQPLVSWEAPERSGDGIKVVVADEQRLFAEALGHALLPFPDLALNCAYFASGIDALQAAIRLTPDVFLCDYWMPDVTGPALARYLARWAPKTRTVLLSWLHGPSQVLSAAASGAVGLVRKSVSVEQLAETVRDAHAGRPLLHAEPIRRREGDELSQRPSGAWELLESLTPRELEVLQRIGQGMTLHEVARHLGITFGTAKNHLSNALNKTGARSRLEAVEHARQEGLVREPGVPPPTGSGGSGTTLR